MSDYMTQIQGELGEEESKSRPKVALSNKAQVYILRYLIKTIV